MGGISGWSEKTGAVTEGRELLCAHSWDTFAGFRPRSAPICHLPNDSWNLTYFAGIKSQTRTVYFTRTWSPSVMWLYLGLCGSCRTSPNMPAPYSKSWKTTSRPQTSGSGDSRVKLTNFSRPALSWTPNRRQCVSSYFDLCWLLHALILLALAGEKGARQRQRHSPIEEFKLALLT